MRSKIKYFGLLFVFCAALSPERASAIPPRNVWVDVGFGIPQLIYGQVQAKVSEHWQLGFAYGIIAGLPASATRLTIPEQTVTLGAAGDFVMSPTATLGIHTFSPLVRYFPGPSNFYLQFGFNLVQATADVTGPLVSTDPLFPVAALINGTVKAILPVPTISVGDIWSGEIYFFAINLGVSFLMSPWTSVTINGGFPEALGDPEANQAALNELSSNFTSSFSDSIAAFRSQYPLLPSIHISFGLIL